MGGQNAIWRHSGRRVQLSNGKQSARRFWTNSGSAVRTGILKRWPGRAAALVRRTPGRSGRRVVEEVSALSRRIAAHQPRAAWRKHVGRHHQFAGRCWSTSSRYALAFEVRGAHFILAVAHAKRDLLLASARSARAAQQAPEPTAVSDRDRPRLTARGASVVAPGTGDAPGLQGRRREYGLYLNVEQRSQAGCSASRLRQTCTTMLLQTLDIQAATTTASLMNMTHNQDEALQRLAVTLTPTIFGCP